jgi:transposase-like protein
MFIMPKAFPEEFRRDVVAVARKGEAPLTTIAKDFGISPAALYRWLKKAYAAAFGRQGEETPASTDGELAVGVSAACLAGGRVDVNSSM